MQATGAAHRSCQDGAETAEHQAEGQRVGQLLIVDLTVRLLDLEVSHEGGEQRLIELFTNRTGAVGLLVFDSRCSELLDFGDLGEIDR
jgi:hypothetical protein